MFLGVFVLANFIDIESAYSEPQVGGGALETGLVTPPLNTSSNASNPGTSSTFCQQSCFTGYKSGTDFCYSTSMASEDLNICIMGKREMFKACSKTCKTK